MKPKIPFSFIPFGILKKMSSVFYGIASNFSKSLPMLKMNLERSGMKIQIQNYLAMSMMASLMFFVFSYIIITLFLFAIIDGAFIVALLVSLPLSLFIFVQQILYPKLLAGKKIKDIERNLLPALQDMLVQLNSGIPLFTILVNISRGNYGQISKEFEGAIKKINAGLPQIEVLDQLASDNPSLYFRRGLWQLVNGMKTGANTAGVVKDIIDSLSEEQLVQVQTYGGQLNPLAMFYMLVSVILPSLGMSFMIIIFSFLAMPETTVKMVFWGLYIFVGFFQILFLGILKAKRPTLLER